MRRVYLIYALSGFVSLGYQVVWFRIFADRFGSSTLTFALVVMNFIAGLGLGAMLSRRCADGLAAFPAGRPATRAYGWVELAVTASMLLTVLSGLLPADLWGSFPYLVGDDGVFHATFGYRAFQIVVAMLTVFVPCMFMGMTFPLLCAAFPGFTRLPSVLYAWNTLGAGAGVLACQFVLLPTIGHDRALWLMIAINGAIGLLFLIWQPPRSEPAAQAVAPQPVESIPRLEQPIVVLLGLSVVSGLLAGALEADAFKRVAMGGLRWEAAMSLISFWAILAIFLASTLVRWWGRLGLVQIKVLYTFALVYYTVLSFQLYPIRNVVLDGMTSVARSDNALIAALLPDPMGFLLVFMGLLVFPPFFAISLLLPTVCNELQARRKHLGFAYGLNTLAFCLGMAGFTWLAPRVSIFYSLKVFPVVFAVLVLGLWLVPRAGKPAPWRPVLTAAALVAALVLTPASFDKRFIDPGKAAHQFPMRAMQSNWDHTLYVVEDPGGDRLFFDSHSMSATGPPEQQYMRLMAHLPLLAQQAPKHALVICFGVGNTSSAVLQHDSVERLDVVDLSNLVYRMAPEFASTNFEVYEDPRIRMIVDDGRNYLNLTDQRYDLITSEPPPPMHTGIYRLYSSEYYAAVLDRLTDNGMMTQWLPVWQMPAGAVELAVSTFVEAFPHSVLYIGNGNNYVLLGSRAPLDLQIVEQQFASRAGVRADLARFQMRSPVELIARIVKGDRTLREEFGGRPTISDQRNDLNFLPLNAGGLRVITYDPTPLDRELGTAGLRSADQLQRAWTNVAVLLSRVRDFPFQALASVRSRPDIRLSSVDWPALAGLSTNAARAEQAGRPDEAVRMYEQFLSVAPDQLLVLNELGRLYAQGGDLQRSLAIWQRYRDVEPDDGIADFGSAQVLALQGRFAVALPYAQRTVRLMPFDGLPLNLLGDVYMGLERYEQAARAYDDALRASPGLEIARRNRDRAVAMWQGR